jgi:hypothetical protein
LVVNPTLLTVTRQRGNLDCGGLRFVIVGYGNFNQVVVGTPKGHLTVCVELGADPARVAEQAPISSAEPSVGRHGDRDGDDRMARGRRSGNPLAGDA